MASAFVESSPHEKGFAAHYEEHLRPRVEAYETRRLSALAQHRKRLMIAVPAGAAVLVLAYVFGTNMESGNALEFIGVVVVGCLWLLWRYVNGPKREYANSIKTEIFPLILKFVGDFRYSATVASRIPQFKDYGIVPGHDNEHSEDGVQGRYKGVDIDLFETRLTQTRGTGKRRRTETVFKGALISLSMNKFFKGKTVVLRDSGAILNWLTDKFSDLETVRLEDPRFERKFEVRSSDQIEARYLLTTSFMERLMDLQESFGGRGLQCSFYRNRLVLMVAIRRNMFEPGPITRREDFVDDARAVLREMQSIFRIIDTLKLDQDTGL